MSLMEMVKNISQQCRNRVLRHEYANSRRAQVTNFISWKQNHPKDEQSKNAAESRPIVLYTQTYQLILQVLPKNTFVCNPRCHLPYRKKQSSSYLSLIQILPYVEEGSVVLQRPIKDSLELFNCRNELKVLECKASKRRIIVFCQSNQSFHVHIGSQKI